MIVLLCFKASLIWSADFHLMKLSLKFKVLIVVNWHFIISMNSCVTWSHSIWHLERSKFLMHKAFLLTSNALAMSLMAPLIAFPFKFTFWRFLLPLSPLPTRAPAFSSSEQYEKSMSSRILLQFKNLETILKSLISLEIEFLDKFNFLTLLFVFRQTISW